jgi:uncharacterized protein (TIGR00730 family)
MTIKSLTIYCSSSNELSRDLYILCDKIGIFLANKSIRIIYGGGKTGLMGRVAKSSLETGGKVIGIIPEFLTNEENINYEITKTIVVDSMSERKKLLFDMSDAFLILPGGPGTIEEATEVISWKILDIHNKDIILFNYKKHWDSLISLYDEAKEKNFGKKNLQNICKHVSTFEEFIKIFP